MSPQYPHLEYSEPLDWIEKIACVLCTIYCILIFCITIRMFVRANLIDLTSIAIKKVACLSLLVLFSYILSCVSVIMNHWDKYDQYIACTILIKMEWCLYVFSKFLLYIFLTFRVDIAFESSSLQYTKCVLNLFRLASFIVLLMICSAIYIFVDGVQIHSQIAFKVPFCQSIVPLQVAIICVVLDTLLACSCLSLFGRKIYQTSMQSMRRHSSCSISTKSKSDATKRREKDQMLMHTFRKNAVLAFIAISSTFVLIFISTVGLTGVTIPLDNCINASCLMVMFAGSQPIYNKLCGRCEECITDSLLAKCACVWSEQHLKRISVIHVESKTARLHSQTSIGKLQKPVAISMGNHKRYLTPTHTSGHSGTGTLTVSITPKSLMTPTPSGSVVTPDSPPLSCNTTPKDIITGGVAHKKRVSFAITPLHYSDQDEKPETFTHMARHIQRRITPVQSYTATDVADNAETDVVERTIVRPPSGSCTETGETKEDYVDSVIIKLDVLNDEEGLGTKEGQVPPIQVLNKEQSQQSRSYNPVSKEFAMVFCKKKSINNEDGK
eukprot:198741_1